LLTGNSLHRALALFEDDWKRINVVQVDEALMRAPEAQSFALPPYREHLRSRSHALHPQAVDISMDDSVQQGFAYRFDGITPTPFASQSFVDHGGFL